MKNITKSDLLEHIVKKERMFDYLLFFCFSVLIVIIGAGLNLQVITSNGDKMPVFLASSLETNKHFTFQEKEEINNFYLADILKVNLNPENDMIFSVGDILMFFGTISTLTFAVYGSYSKAQLRTVDKKIKKLLKKQKKR